MKDEGLPPRKRCRGNLKPAPFAFSPDVVRQVVALSERSRKRMVLVPVLPVKLVDRPRRSEDPRLARANDDMRERAGARDNFTPSATAGSKTADSEGGCEGREPEGSSGAAVRGKECAPANFRQPHDKTPEGPVKAKRETRISVARDAVACARERPVDVCLVDDKQSRLDLIRVTAQKLTAPNPAKIALGMAGGRPVDRKISTLPSDPFAEKRARLESAIAYLRGRGIMVAVTERGAALRTYRVSGHPGRHFASDVIAIAAREGLPNA